MTVIRLKLERFNKDVLVEAGFDSDDLSEVFNEVSAFVRKLEADNKIRDLENGVDPSGATHEIIRGERGAYHLRRFRMA